MKDIINKIIEIIVRIIPFIGSKTSEADKEKIIEFGELVKNQYGFLIEKLEKVVTDYCDLSDRIKELHEEIYQLKEQLIKSSELQCIKADCELRNRNKTSKEQK